MWDLSVLGLVPGLRVAAPRDAGRLRALLDEAVDDADGPTAVRFPKGNAGPDLATVGRLGSADVLFTRPDAQILLVAVGPMARTAVAKRRRNSTGWVSPSPSSDPRWIQPIDPELLDAVDRYIGW